MRRILILAAILFTPLFARAQTLTSVDMAFSPVQPTAQAGQAFSTTVTVTNPSGGAPVSGTVWIDKITKASDSSTVFDAGSTPSEIALSASGTATLTHTLSATGSYTVDVCYKQLPTSGCLSHPRAFVVFMSAVSTTTPTTPSTTTPTQSGGDTTTPTSVTIPNPIPCADATCVISQVIKYVLGSIALIATGMFIWGGFLMLTSAGNSKRVDQAKETLAWAAIGIVVIILSWAIISYLLSTLTRAAHN